MEVFGRVIAQVDSWSQWLVGSGDGRSTYAVTRWLFLRALGLIYLIAFASFWVQVKGLIGSQGILPADQSLQALKGYLGSERYRLVPTLFWFGSSDLALQLACAAGVGCALLLVGNVAPIPALIVLWVLYLSLAAVGRDFLAFQWDVLLLEAGLLAIFFAPARLLPGRADTAPVSAMVLLLLWWLLFRLTFQSGLTKLTWGDPVWRDGTALEYHFYTQPLPTWTAWFAQQLPSWLRRVAVLLMYVLEIGFPLLIFGPRAARLVACAGIVLLQVAIFKTGNYTFFNLLTLMLALLLVDDAAWARLLPDRFIQGFAAGGGSAGLAAGAFRTLLAVLVLAISGVKFWENLPHRVCAPVRCATRTLGRSVPQRQQLRAVSRHDDHVQVGDHHRGERRRQHMARLRVQVQAGRRDAAAGVRGAAPAAARLADVVRGAEQLRRDAMVSGIARAPARGLASRARTAGAEPLPRASASVHPGDALRLPVHDGGGAKGNRGVVVTDAGG